MKEKIKEFLSISPFRLVAFVLLSVIYFSGIIIGGLAIETLISFIVYLAVAIFVLFEKPFGKILPIAVIFTTLILASYLTVSLEEMKETLSSTSIHRTFFLTFFVLFVILSIGYSFNEERGKWISGLVGVAIYTVLLLNLVLRTDNELLLYGVPTLFGVVLPLGLERGAKFVLSFRNKK